MHKLSRFIVIIALFAHKVTAQDYHFTQYDRAMLLLNPSAAGNFDGFERFSMQNRNQWVGAGTRFMTSLATAEFTFGKNNVDNKSYAGMGLHFNRDVGGDSRFGSNAIGASLSGHLVTSKRSKFSAGIQTSVSNRSGDLSNLLFYSQWNGSTFDPNIPTNEPNQIARFSYIDAGAGVSYTFSTKGNRVAQMQQRYVNVGVFAQHVSRPKLRYNEITYDRLQVKVGGHLETEFNIGYGLALEFKTIQMLQGKHYVGRYGMLFKAFLKQSASITRFKNDTFFSAGIYMSSTGTLSPVFIVDLGGFQLGMNYDLELAKISRAYRSSIEFSLSYSFTKSSLFKRSKIR